MTRRPHDAGRGAYISAGAAALLLGVSRSTVIRWIRRATLAGTRECPTCAPDDDGCRACRWFASRDVVRARVEAMRQR